MKRPDIKFSSGFSATLFASFLVLSATPPHAMASSSSIDDNLLQKIDQENIAYDAGWLALLHYRNQGNNTWRSEAASPAFFLDAEGKSSPRSELIADIRAALSPERSEFVCRFPARYEWLARRFKISDSMIATNECPSLSAWYSIFTGDRISINFASSYLENPSSMFGHTFLKVFAESNRELLSPTINYAAKTEAKENDLSFIRKGLFGGFPGVADELPFYRRLRTYSENEGRDIWEYELVLSPAEIRLLLLHLWEIRNGVFDYYFLDENCAYQTLALIDVARPDLGLLKEYTGATIPIDTIRTLKASGLIKEQRLWPAFPKLVRNHEQQLGVDDNKMAFRISAGEVPPETIAQFQPSRQAAILQLAYEFLSVQISRDKADRNTRKTILNSIIKRRIELNSTSSLTASQTSTPPEYGHESSPVTVGRFNNEEGSGYTLAWAAFQHTLTDNLAGYEPYAEVTILRPEIRFSNSHDFRLHSLDWIEVKSVVPNSPLFASSTWSVQLATRDRIFDNGYHRVTSLTYSSGLAWSFYKTVVAFLPGVNVEIGSPFPHKLAATGSFSLSIDHQSEFWSSQLQLVDDKYFLGSSLNRTSAQLINSQHISRNTSIVYTARRSFSPAINNEFVIEIKHFFHHHVF